MWRLFPGRFGDEASFLPRLKQLAEVACKVLVLEEPPDRSGDVEDDLQPAEPQAEVGGGGCTALSRFRGLLRCFDRLWWLSEKYILMVVMVMVM